MKIKTIEIHSYKVFLDSHKLVVGGENLFIYGGNGSGKSSLYHITQTSLKSRLIKNLKSELVQL